jgi:hypothetical protein
MSYSFDVFVAAMKCFSCGRISPADDSTNMQTYLRDDPQLENLGVGSFVGDSFNEMRDKHYLTLSKKKDSAENLLDTWTCPYCGYANWAKISIKNGIITEIQSVEISRDTLDKASYISIEVSGVAMYLSGEDYVTVQKNGVLETLTKYLD